MPRKILVVQIKHIGEILFTTPLLRVLRGAYPDAQIDFLIERPFHDLVACNPHLSQTIVIDRKGTERRFGGFLRLLLRLRRARYDLVLTNHRGEYLSALVAFSGARRKVGPSVWWLRPWFHASLAARYDIHHAEVVLESAYAAGVPCLPHQGLEMWVSAESEQRAAERWQAAGVAADARVIGLNPGGSWPAKRWTVEGFAALTDLLRARGMVPAFFGGQTDVAVVEAIAARTGAAPLTFAGQLSLMDSAAMLSRCAAFVSADSGPMHLATARRVPVVALFGPTDPRRFAPLGTPYRLVQTARRCAQFPCFNKDCPDPYCMTEIRADDVLAAIDELLASVPRG